MKRLTITMLILTVLGLILGSLPLVIQSQVETWLKNNGADTVSIGDIDLNLFTGKLGIFDVEIVKDGEKRLRFWRMTADLDWWPLFGKRVLVKDIWVYDLDVLIVQSEKDFIEVGGIAVPLTSSASVVPAAESNSTSTLTWGIGLDALGIKNSSIRIRSAQYAADELLQIKSLYMSDVLSWTPDQPAPINLDMLINGDPVQIYSRVRVFQKKPDIKSKLTINTLDLSHYAAIAKLFGIQDLAGVLTLTMISDALQQEKNKFLININTDVVLEDFRIQLGDTKIMNQNFNYQGQAAINLPPATDNVVVKADGEVNMDGFSIALNSTSARYDNLIWHGYITVHKTDKKISDEAPRIILGGDVDIREVVVDDNQRKINLVSINKITATELAVISPETVKFDTLSMAAISALKPLTTTKSKQSQIQERVSIPLVDIANAQIDAIDFDFKSNALSLGIINITGLNAFLKRESNGSLYVVDRLSGVKQGSGEPVSMAGQSDGGNAIHDQVAADQVITATETESGSSTPLQMRIAKISIADHSGFTFVDQSTKPEFKANLKPLYLEVDNIDNKQPESKSTLAFNASLSKGNDISVTGWIAPFAEKRNAEIKGNIKALDLVFISPYAHSAIGYLIKSGRLNSTFDVAINNDQLNAQTKYEFQRLTLASASNDARIESTKNLGIPLGSALALMKDGNGNIKLDVPFAGDLADPAFSLGPVVRSAGAEAIKKASVAYATLALQPYGAIILGAKLLSAATAMRLDSVRFDPGSTVFNSEAQRYLDKIGQLMKDRPGINLTLCGSATQTDEEALKNLLQANQKTGTAVPPPQQKTPAQLEAEAKSLLDKLHELADQRGERVKDYLIDRQKINADRFFDCQTEINLKAGSIPEVALGL